jgi:hypothetical protein
MEIFRLPIAEHSRSSQQSITNPTVDAFQVILFFCFGFGSLPIWVGQQYTVPSFSDYALRIQQFALRRLHSSQASQGYAQFIRVTHYSS